MSRRLSQKSVDQMATKAVLKDTPAVTNLSAFNEGGQAQEGQNQGEASASALVHRESSHSLFEGEHTDQTEAKTGDVQEIFSSILYEESDTDIRGEKPAIEFSVKPISPSGQHRGHAVATRHSQHEKKASKGTAERNELIPEGATPSVSREDSGDGQGTSASSVKTPNRGGAQEAHVSPLVDEASLSRIDNEPIEMPSSEEHLIRESELALAASVVEEQKPVEVEVMKDPTFLDDFDSETTPHEELEEASQRDISQQGSAIQSLFAADDFTKSRSEMSSYDLKRISTMESAFLEEEKFEEEETYICGEGVEEEVPSKESITFDTGPVFDWKWISRRLKPTELEPPRSVGSGELGPSKAEPYPPPLPAFTSSKTPQSDYLREHVGKQLIQCLAQVAFLRPCDPIEYIAHWLYREKVCESQREKFQDLLSTLAEIKKERLEEQRLKELGSIEEPEMPWMDEDMHDTESFLRLLEAAGLRVRDDKDLKMVGEEQEPFEDVSTFDHTW